MLYPDTNQMLSVAFQNGGLPTMVYINKQNYERKAVRRPLHRHDSICELLLIYKGTGFCQADGNLYPLEEGSVVYFNRGGVHEMLSETDQEIGSYCIGIANLHLFGLPQNCLIAQGEPLVRKAGALFPMLKSMCQQMFELEGTNEEGKLAAQFLCAALIVVTRRLDTFPLAMAKLPEDAYMVLRIRNYLNENFTQDVTLETIGDALGCSATYVSHVFKKSAGITPIQYVIQRRIGHAQTLLISTDYSASHIATLVGYDNPNYFNTLFSKIVGMSPIRYREFYKEEMKGQMNQM